MTDPRSRPGVLFGAVDRHTLGDLLLAHIAVRAWRDLLGLPT